ncbi:hypothetical protein LC605_15080 [Nostoc sp. CHAB 5836]|uniref:hypothetical protein n=1 Tax=Nostoc sp. CHAB 5836 TaxID=2780404 RepID=UPI001E5A31EF|nr:hypothetical protein [Nostoc sp. CHAB 5836]MCC5616369.1 hypothetical protein [Nostoc sp. CHAB 5836]
MAVILFTMRDIEKTLADSLTLRYQYAEFAEIGAGRRRARGGGGVAALENVAIKPSKFRPGAGTVAVADPFAASASKSITQQVKQAVRDAPTFLRKTKRGGIAIVKKGLRQSKRAINKIVSPGVKAGAGNISTGLRQIGSDAALASRRAGRGALRHLGANKGKYALAGAALAAGAGYLATRPKEQQYSRYSRRPTSIYFSRR